MLTRLQPTLARGRSMAQARMTSVCTIRRQGGTTTDPDGFKVPGWTSVHTDLPCRIKGGASRTVTIGGVEFQEATAEAHLPASTLDLADNDVLDLTAGEWAGSAFRVVEAVKGDQQTARRVPVVEVERLAVWG